MIKQDKMMEEHKIEIYTKEWCPYCRKAKAFFDSQNLKYMEYDVEVKNNWDEMIKRSGGEKTVPQIFIDNQHIGGYDDLIEQETTGELKNRLGLSEQKYDNKTWDLIIIGAGPAGLTAAVYAVRKGLKTLVLAKTMGGQVLETDIIENYLGKYKIKGPKLMQDFWNHVQQYDISTVIGEEVKKIQVEDNFRIIETENGKRYKSQAIIIASGSHKRHLGIPGENRLKGKGVHYCAICDGFLYAEKPVAVVGGGNSGLEASLDMADLGSQVFLIEIQDNLMGDKYLQKQVNNSDQIDIFTSHSVKEIKGKKQVESLVIRGNKTGKTSELEVDAVFIEAGLIPNSRFTNDLIDTNNQDEIIIDNNNQTNLEGVWAAGDVTDIKDKQIIIASAEGAAAALRVSEYLK